MSMPIKTQRVSSLLQLDLSPGAVLPCDDHDGEQVLLTISGSRRNRPGDTTVWVYGFDQRGQARVVPITERNPVQEITRRAM